jgi:hypothetical protein
LDVARQAYIGGGRHLLPQLFLSFLVAQEFLRANIRMNPGRAEKKRRA